MGIIIDIILIAIITLSAFLGYKKGLVKLGTGLIAGIVAIIATVIIYKPVAGIIINNTTIDEKIESAIMQNTTSFIEENTQVPNEINNQIKDNILPEQAKNIAENSIYAVTLIVIFIAIKIALSIIISLMDFIANLPILKQFNEVGGIIYGLIRGVLIVCICILLMGIFTKINPQNTLNENIENSYLTKIIYRNIVKF